MKELTKIKVETLKNGYSLTVGDGKYMYLSPKKLIEGLFIHVGLELTDYMSEVQIQDLMTACASWPEAKEAIQAAGVMNAENDRLRRQVANLKEVVWEQKKRILKLSDDMESVRGKNSMAQKKEEQVKVKNPLLRMTGKLPKEQKPSRKGGRNKADAAVLAEIERQAQEHWKEEGYTTE